MLWLTEGHTWFGLWIFYLLLSLSHLGPILDVPSGLGLMSPYAPFGRDTVLAFACFDSPDCFEGCPAFRRRPCVPSYWMCLSGLSGLWRRKTPCLSRYIAWRVHTVIVTVGVDLSHPSGFTTAEWFFLCFPAVFKSLSMAQTKGLGVVLCLPSTECLSYLESFDREVCLFSPIYLLTFIPLLVKINFTTYICKAK